MTQKTAFLIVTVASLVLAQWGPDVRLTNDTTRSEGTLSNAWCVAATGDTVHVFWDDEFKPAGETLWWGRICYRRSFDGGTTWSAMRRLSDSAFSRAWYPCIYAAGASLHLAWYDMRNGNSEAYYKRSTDAGTTWGPDTRLTFDINGTYNPSVAVSGSTVHVIYSDWRTGLDIRYRRSTDAGTTWGADTLIAASPAYDEFAAAAAVGSVVHVAWQSSRDGNFEIYYKRSTDGGTTWQADTRLTNAPDSSVSAAIAASGSTVHAVWFDKRSGDCEIYHKRSTDAGVTWGADNRLTNSAGRSTHHSVATVGSNVHVVWEDERDGNREIYYKLSTDAGITWGADTRLTNAADTSFWPSVAATAAAIHVAWSDKRDGNAEMYYKRNPPATSMDAGCTRIVAPTGTIDSGTVVTPRAWVRNYRTLPASFGVRFGIGSFYTDSVTVSNLAGGDSVQVSFTIWVALQPGLHIVRCSTMLTGDENPANDRRVDSVRVVVAPRPFDVGVTQIVAPFGDVDPGSTVIPTASWRNFGDTVASFFTWFSLRNPRLALVYSQLLPVGSLAGGAETTLAFPPFVLDTTEGRWFTRCSTFYAEDINPTNDTLSGSFTISTAPPWPDTWGEGEPVPSAGGRGIKDGGWLVVPTGLTDGPRYIFAAKGNKTGEFYRYEVATGLWSQAASIPLGREGKLPNKGCKASVSDVGHVYMTKGNSTLGFWRYSPGADSWQQLADVPAGTSNKKVKGGNDLACFMKAGEQYVYLVKGQKTNEFWRYRASGDSWSPLEAVPVDLPAIKTNAGSWLELVEEAVDAHPYLYLHKASYHHLHRYNLVNEAWLPGRRTGIPFVGKSGRSKKSKDGGSATFWNGDIYALKGGNTCEFWKYSPATDQWNELPSIPEIGASGKKKKVKAGADVASVGGGAFFVTKGNKTNECWRVVLQGPGLDGVTSVRAEAREAQLAIGPNPLRAGFATLRWDMSGAGHDRIPFGQFGSCPRPASVSIYDASGRCVVQQACGVKGSASGVTLDLRSLPAGVYMLRLEHKGYRADRKLVVVSP